MKNCSDFFGAKLKRKEGFEREGAVSHCYVVVFGVWKCSKESLISGLEGFVVNSDQIPQTLYSFFFVFVGFEFWCFLVFDYGRVLCGNESDNLVNTSDYAPPCMGPTLWNTTTFFNVSFFTFIVLSFYLVYHLFRHGWIITLG